MVLDYERHIVYDVVDSMLDEGYYIGIERNGEPLLRPTNDSKQIKLTIDDNRRLLIRGGNDKAMGGSSIKTLWLVVR